MAKRIPEQQPAGYFVDCPDCREELRIHRHLQGATIRCRACDCTFHLDPASPAIKLNAIYVYCPHCEKELRAASQFLGTKVACKFCRKPLAIAAPKPSDTVVEQNRVQSDKAKTEGGGSPIDVGPASGTRAGFDLSEFELESVDPAELEQRQKAAESESHVGETSDADKSDSVQPLHDLSELDFEIVTESTETARPAAPDAAEPAHPAVAAESAASANTTSTPTPVASEDTAESEDEIDVSTDVAWYIQSAGQEIGPVTLAALQGMATAGKISLDDQIRVGKTGQFFPLRPFHEMFTTMGVIETTATPKSPAASVSEDSPSQSSAEAPPDFDELIASALQMPPTGQVERSLDEKPVPAADVAESPPADVVSDTSSDQTDTQHDADDPSRRTSAQHADSMAGVAGAAVQTEKEPKREAAKSGGGLARSLVEVIQRYGVAVIVVLAVAGVGWAIYSWISSGSREPQLRIVRDETFNEDRPTVGMLQAMIHDKTITHEGRTWKLMPVTNVELRELGEKDGDGYQTATVSLNAFDEEGTSRLSATIKLTFKPTSIEKDGDRVVRALYDVKTVEKVSAQVI